MAWFPASKTRSWLLPLAALVALVVVLWLPFGLKVTGLMEEWIILHSLESGAPSERDEDFSLFITTGTQRVRPLAASASILGYALTPDSFVGLNLVMMGLFVGKGMVLYLILRKFAPLNEAYCLLVALLFVVYPADSGLFTFRAINIHLAVFLCLLGIYWFFVYFQTGRWWALVASWLALVGGLWIYEVGYLLIGLTPILLVWLEGRLNRRVLNATALLYAAPLAALLYVAYAFVQGNSYQSWLLQRSGLNQTALAGEMFASLSNAYALHFAEGWLQALRQLATPYIGLTLLTGAGALLLGGLLARQGQSNQVPKRRYWLLALLGFALVGVGYAPFLITPYRQLDWRVFYFSSIGGAICVGSLVYLLVVYARLRPLVFVGIMSVLVALGTLRSLNQHEYFADLGENQQRLLYGIAQQIPGMTEDVPLVIVDETGRYYDNWSLGTGFLLTYALRFLYADYALDAVLCSFDAEAQQFVVLPEQNELCAFSPSGVLWSSMGGEQTAQFGYDELILIRSSDEGVAVLDQIPPNYLRAAPEQVYNPERFIDQAASPPHRFYTLFSITA